VPEFSGEQQVLPDGTINLTLLGTVPVEGMTLQEAADYIATQYSSYLNSPIVNLRIVTPRAVRIAVAGEVNRPGPYTLSDGGAAGGGGDDGPAATPVTTTVPTVTSLIQQAGGITPQANVRDVQVKRPLPSGQIQTFNVDLWEMVQNGNLAADMKLLDGDTVVVAKGEGLNPEEATQLASANFSPSEISVNVVGEVASPGTVQLKPNTPLNQAILAAGGFNERARRSKVGLLRLNPDGTVEQRDIEIDFDSGISEETNPTLRNTDVVVVKRSGASAAADALTSVFAPFGAFGDIFGIARDVDSTFGGGRN
jgi:polysaccharide export outer membrane protein